jgi:hypothetical protein
MSKRIPAITANDPHLARNERNARHRASAPASISGAARPALHSGPLVKTNITIPRELLTALRQVLLSRQQAALSRGDRGPRGISELISEALGPWLASNAAGRRP